MKFQLSTQELSAAIGKLQNVAGVKPTIPILSNFLIEASNNTLSLTATDLTVGIRCQIKADVIEEGSTTLPVKKFAQLIYELTATQTELKTNASETTTVISGSSRFKLNGMNKNEFPSLPDISNAQQFKIKQSLLKELIYRTSFAASKDNDRHIITGICMQIANGTLTLTATDGKRLARCLSPIKIDPSFNCNITLPAKAMDEFFKNLDDTSEEEATVYLLSDKVAIGANQTLIITKLLAGEYPNVSQVIPQSPTTQFSIHREELISILRQISLFTADNDHSVRLRFSPGEVKIQANTKLVGEGDVEMPVNYQGPNLEISFNPANLLDILRHCKKETVLMALIDPYNPGLLTDEEDLTHPHENTLLYLLMPMRSVVEE